MNGKQIDVKINLADMAGEDGQTLIPYDQFTMVQEFSTGKKSLVPTGISNNTIYIDLFYKGRTLSTLANEFGDAIFGVENSKSTYRDRKLTYYSRSSTIFSFLYEDYIMKGGKKPNPEDY